MGWRGKSLFSGEISMSKISKRVRKDVIESYGYRCVYCGMPHRKNHNDEITIDHVVPRESKGKTHFKNLVTCCKTCNKLKANKNLLEFFCDPKVLSRQRQFNALCLRKHGGYGHLHFDASAVSLCCRKRN
jgi:5-methylcytosine-specific restriction endonuclease McrA